MAKPVVKKWSHLNLELVQLEAQKAEIPLLPPDLDLDEIVKAEGFKGFTLGQAGLLTFKPPQPRRMRS